MTAVREGPPANKWELELRAAAFIQGAGEYPRLCAGICSWFGQFINKEQLVTFAGTSRITQLPVDSPSHSQQRIKLLLVATCS